MKDNNIYNIFDEDKNEKETEETDNSNNIEQNFLGKKTNYRKDNIRSKIINHYCNFIINFLNDYVKKIFGFQKILFIKINYESKKNVNVTSIKNLMNLTIHQFCCLPISSKNPIFPQNHNINNLKIIQNKFEHSFINKKLSDFYSNYYLQDNNCLKDYGITQNTKNFNNLLEEFQENEIYKEKLKDSGLQLINVFMKKKPRIRRTKESKKKQILIYDRLVKENIYVQQKDEDDFFQNKQKNMDNNIFKYEELNDSQNSFEEDFFSFQNI